MSEALIVRRRDIVAEARKLIGLSFVHQGRSGLGVDCVGVAAIPMRVLGLPVPDLANYNRYSAGEALPMQLALIGDRIRLSEARPGDALTFRRGRHEREEHFAWLVDYWRMLHAWDITVGVVEHEFDERWRKRHVATWRIRGVI